MHIAQSASPREIQKSAEELYRGGYFCCEALMSAIKKGFDLDVPDEVIAMSSGMSVGAGRSGCMCGALNYGLRYVLWTNRTKWSKGSKGGKVYGTFQRTSQLV